MSVTLNLIKWGIKNYVPMGEHLPYVSDNLKDKSGHSINKTKQRARIAIGKRICQDQANLCPERVKAAKEMINKGKKGLNDAAAERNYSKVGKVISELEKLALPADFALPGAGLAITSITGTLKTANFLNFAKNTSTLGISVLKKLTLDVGLAIVSQVGTPIIKEALEPVKNTVVPIIAANKIEIIAVGVSAVSIDVAHTYKNQTAH